MRKIRINENQVNGIFNTKNSFDANGDDNFNFDFIKELEHDEDDESSFYEELNRLSSEGVLAFQTIKKLYQEHPYALNNSDLLSKELDKIEKIIKVIETIYEP